MRISCKKPVDSLRSHGIHAIRRILRSSSNCRRSLSTSHFMQASHFNTIKASKPAPKTSQKKIRPLDYKTPTRKPLQGTHSSTSSIPPRPNPFRYNTIPIIVLSVTAFAISGYSTYLYIQLSRVPTGNVPTTANLQEDVSSRYNSIASTFDAEVSFTENIMGITSLRRRLASLAHGDVLEVSIGTGRNLEFYDFDFKSSGGSSPRKGEAKGSVRSFTAIDKSPEMLGIAHEKFSHSFPGILGVRWVIGDASESGMIPPPPRNANERSGPRADGKKYDTIIQTMGLCSVDDPVRLLKNLGEVVQEESGRILLLEHGRGRWEWLNGVLDKFAEGHAKQFGCWWNRDFEDVIKECGLEVVKVERPRWWHGGTTWWIELKKIKDDSQVRDSAKRKDVLDAVGTRPEVQKEKKSWW